MGRRAAAVAEGRGVDRAAEGSTWLVLRLQDSSPWMPRAPGSATGSLTGATGALCVFGGRGVSPYPPARAELMAAPRHAVQAGAAGGTASRGARQGQRRRLHCQLPGQRAAAAAAASGGCAGCMQLAALCLTVRFPSPSAMRVVTGWLAAAPRGWVWGWALPAGTPGAHLRRGLYPGHAGRRRRAARWGRGRACGGGSGGTGR